ncbi:hypothetical protein [Extibacter muris]|uniref:hypothetical protein n=1 Tax=Extibacter muris TaxID=1796622 RepID=UPI001D05E704|nr:hypothetical protein [Extibacter muris]MCB6203598.1 hypothetical protein [Extibacter muris]MCQ4665127.1 hypothetical protein [Extibacter muris]MCQ4694492.1 hypothetical protein [Extibacter muris]
MKKRVVCVLAGTVMTAMVVSGCQKGSTEEKTETLYGEIAEIDGDKITLALAEEPEMGEAPSGEKPEGEAPGTALTDGESSDGSQTPPEKPDGGSISGGEAPEGEAPDGEAPDGGDMPQDGPGGITLTGEEQTIITDKDTMVEKTSLKGAEPGNEDADEKDADAQADTKEASLDDLKEGDVVSVEVQGEKAASITIQYMGSMSDATTGNIELSGVYTVDGKEEMSDAETYASTNADENAVLVKNGGALELTNTVLHKTGDSSSEDESNFYAVNAALAASEGSTATMSDITLTSDAEGSNAIFATGEDSKITVNNVKIHTKGNSSRGLDATYGGSVIATNVDITTEGAHCAPIATDRGEGTITVDSGTLSAAGEGSPCVYSTGNITVKGVTGTASGSQAAVVEGKNSITLEECDLTGAGENGVMLYQSTSGDAAEGTAKFSASDSKLSFTSSGPMFYITNTDAEATLENTELAYNSDILVRVSGNNTNNWGKEGSNGGDFKLNGVNQKLTGDITCDEISTVEVSLTKGSILKGTLNGENTGKEVRISLDKDSRWELSGDSYITSITDKDKDLENIASNGHNIYYDASDSSNEWLDGETFELNGGGSLTPAA